MFNFNVIITYVLALILFSGIKSNADTFVVTNLNDPGAGSLRRAIENSNSHEGPDTIVFQEGLQGTIVLNHGPMFIQDDLTVMGPGADTITIDADGRSDIFPVTDYNNNRNRVVQISGLRFVNGNAFEDGVIVNYEILTIDSCEFLNSSATYGGAIGNRRILTVNSSNFENNNADLGGAIMNFSDGTIVSIRNSEFRNNHAAQGGAIRNSRSTIYFITNSIFYGNSSTQSGGAIRNVEGTIKEISNSTFNNNLNTGIDNGGAITNHLGLIEIIINCTFNHNNSTYEGGAISDGGVSNISFCTFANNQASNGGALQGGQLGGAVTRIRNSILASNSPNDCIGVIDDYGGNYSEDFSCGFTGDNAFMLIGPLADNGGPTQTIALLGGDPVDGATFNCDALGDDGNPTGIPVGIDQRYFQRPSGIRCDSGAIESGALEPEPSSSVTITKVTSPEGGADFNFDSIGFGSLVGCGLRGDEGGSFVLNDGDSVNCTVPEGDYSIREDVPGGYELAIICLEAPDNITINNETGEIEFTIEGPGSDVDCVYTNTRTGGGNGGCSLAPAGANYTFPLYLFAPALIMVRRIVKLIKVKRE